MLRLHMKVLRLASEHTCSLHAYLLPAVAAEAEAKLLYACTRWPGALKKLLLVL